MKELASTQDQLSLKEQKTIRYAFISVIVLFLLNLLLLFLPYTNEELGQLGDQFGIVNALFSGLAFAGLIATILMQNHQIRLQREDLALQREDLKLQRQEMARSRAEMKLQTRQFELQNQTLKIQKFESTFFQMMQLQQQIVDGLYIHFIKHENIYDTTAINPGFRTESIDESPKGRAVFNFMMHSYDIVNIADAVSQKGVDGYSMGNFALLDHYFRHLYTIIRFVDSTNVFDINEKREIDLQEEKSSKYRYVSILRATLSRGELLTLYYNGLSSKGRRKMKPLIEKYSLLNNIDKEGLSLSLENCFPSKTISETSKYLKSLGFSGTDYELFMTNEYDDVSKYHYSAFCTNKEEKDVAEAIIAKIKAIKESLTNKS